MKVVSARSAFLSDWEVLHLMREMDTKARRQSQRRLQKQAREQDGGPSRAGPLSRASQATSSTRPTTRSSIAAAATAGEGGVTHPEEEDRNNDGAAIDDAEEQALQSLPSNLRTIQYSVMESLSDIHRPCAHQTRQHIPRFLDALHAWERGQTVPALDDGQDGEAQMPRQAIDKDKRLTKGERLMMVNRAPASELELYTIVEEMTDRFSDAERAELIWLVSAYLPLDTAAIEAHDNRLDEGAAGEQGIDDADRHIEVDESGTQVADEPLMEDVDGAHLGGSFDDEQGEDTEMLENEMRTGEGAVDDEVPDDDD